MDLSDGEFSFDGVVSFVEGHQKILERENTNFDLKQGLRHRHSVSAHDGEFSNYNSTTKDNMQLQYTVSNQAEGKKMVKDKSRDYVHLNTREKEKVKTRHSYPNIKSFNKNFFSYNLNQGNTTLDDREKEKERLAEIFASSDCNFFKLSNYQISKELSSKICCDKNNKSELNKTKDECSKLKDQQARLSEEQKNNCQSKQPLFTNKNISSSNTQNYNVPRILVSEYQENLTSQKTKTNTEEDYGMVRIGEFSPLNPNHPTGKPTLGFGEYEGRRKLLLDQRKQEYNDYLQQEEDNSMVKIGEFSPHNPNHPTGKPTLGFGEYEGRRKLLLDQRKQEYNDYLQQLSRSQTPPVRDNSTHNHKLKDVATQTKWDEEATYSQDMQRSPRNYSNAFVGEGERYCMTPPCSRASPVPKCFEGLSEKEVREFLYREELRKQIEEKNRLKEEKKRKEAEEEAKIEAKFRRDQEIMKRQYEAERLHRVELAIRKKEQEDILRQRLAAEQQKVLEENKAKRKQLLSEKSLSPNYTSSQRSMKSGQFQRQNVYLSQSMPANSASTALSDVHEVLRQPLLELQSDKSPTDTVKQSPPERDKFTNKVNVTDHPSDVNQRSLVTMSPPIHRVKKVDVVAQKAVFEPNSQRSVSQQTYMEPSMYTFHNVNEKLQEVDRLLKQPLFPETNHALPPMSPPLLYATIPPVTPSLQPTHGPPPSPIPQATKQIQRTDSEILEDKWKVPYVERNNTSTSDVSTKHNRSVLTQLGAFRRHLQQERLRMQERVQDDSP